MPSIYAAGDVTAKLMLASVAATQGRIAMYHLLGQAVAPLRWDAVAATIFTDPQIATVGLSEQRWPRPASSSRSTPCPWPATRGPR